MEELTKVDLADFKRLESVVELGKNTFVTVGLALTEIRDRRLYRQEYATFEDYCQKRWGWSGRRGRQLIEAASAVAGLDPTEIPNERAARALAKVPREKRKAVIAKAKSDGNPVTAKAIDVASKPVIDLDATGWPIPKGVMKYWDRMGEVQQLLSAITKIKSILKQADEAQDAMFAELNMQVVIGDLDKAYAGIKCAKPFAVCPSCQGHPETQPKNLCRMCIGRGLISEMRWDRLVPKEIKEIRKKGAKK